MSDDAARDAARKAIARHLARQRGDQPAAAPPAAPGHPAFTVCLVPAGGEGGAAGACLIEPAVLCTHCGFCQSQGY